MSCSRPHSLGRIILAADECPLNFGFLGRGNSNPDAEAETVAGGALGVNIHGDFAASPAVMDGSLRAADASDFSVHLQTDTINEFGFYEDTMAAIAGRTTHMYHTECAGGGHAPDLLGRRARCWRSSLSPFVLLPGAALRQELALTLHPNATVVLCDGICLRDQADAGLSWQSVLTTEREYGSKLFRDAQSVEGPALARLSELHGDARAFASVSVLAPEPVLGFLETALRPALASLEGYAACAPLRGGAGWRCASPARTAAR